MNIQDITSALISGRVRITDHADEEAQADRLTFDQIYYSVLLGEVIEDYPNRKPYPSCLVFGQSFNGDPIHSVWAFNPESRWVVLITVYRPDPNLWIDWQVRRTEP